MGGTNYYIESLLWDILVPNVNPTETGAKPSELLNRDGSDDDDDGLVNTKQYYLNTTVLLIVILFFIIVIYGKHGKYVI